MLYDYQRYKTIPYLVDEGFIKAAMIVSRTAASRDAYKGLLKAGVVTPEGVVDTTRIDRHFRNHVAILHATQQRQVIVALFWWEEETQRLRKLLAERRELETLTAESSAEALPQYRRLLERVNAKIMARPSERLQAVEEDADELMVRFMDGTLFAPPAAGSYAQARRTLHDEELPGYSRREAPRTVMV
jgi:hypothetical protein